MFKTLIHGRPSGARRTAEIRPERGGTPAAAAPAVALHTLIARQPIFGRSGRLFGYELLFRATPHATSASEGGEVATASVLTAALSTFNLEALTGGHVAFVNFTRQLLLEAVPQVLPPGRVVIELLESIEADAEVLDACRVLKRDGYSIALDDYALTEQTVGLLPVADIVKVDALAVPLARARALVEEAAGPRRVMLLAEKIESVEQFEEATREGYEYFQGYFFGRPVTSSRRTVPGRHLAYLKLLQVLHDPNSTPKQIERLVKNDASLSLRLLRTANSARTAHGATVSSVERALLLLGREVACRWASLWILAGVAEAAHPELLSMSVIRARFCEVLAAQTQGEEHGSEAFLLGMCSLLGAILACPMSEVLDQVPLPAPIRGALAGDDTPNRRLLDCVVAYERGDWAVCLGMAARLGLREDVLAAAHHDALQWAHELGSLTRH